MKNTHPKNTFNTFSTVFTISNVNENTLIDPFIRDLTNPEKIRFFRIINLINPTKSEIDLNTIFEVLDDLIDFKTRKGWAEINSH